MRLDAKGAARLGQHDMGVDFGRGVRRHHDPVLLGQLRDPQRLGEAARARRVELDIADAAIDDEVAHREPGQLALAMGQRDRGRRRQTREIGRLQVPVQRLLEPEDAMRLDRMGKFDAVRQIVGRVHVEHQQRLVADHPPHRADPLGLLGDGAGPGLELDRAVAELHEPAISAP